MTTARIKGDNLRIRMPDGDIEADWIEVDAAPEQPGTVITGFSEAEGVICVYLDKDGEPCDETTVRFSLLKGPARNDRKTQP